MNELEFERDRQEARTLVIEPPADDEQEIDLIQLMLGVLRDWKLLLLAAAVCALLGAAAAKVLPRAAVSRSYTASTTVYVTKRDPFISTQADGAPDLILNYLSKTATKNYDPAQDFTSLVKDSTVLQRVIDDLDLDMSAGALADSINTPLDRFTRMVRVELTDGDPDRARAILERLVEVSVDTMAAMMGDETLVSGHTDVSMEESVSGGLSAKKLALIGAAAGLFLMALLSAILGILDRRIKTAEDVANWVDLPIIAVIPQQKN